MAHRCKNKTLPQTSFSGGRYYVSCVASHTDRLLLTRSLCFNANDITFLPNLPKVGCARMTSIFCWHMLNLWIKLNVQNATSYTNTVKYEVKFHFISTRSQQMSHQRWIWGIHCMQATKYASNGSSLALKPRGHVTRSPKTGISLAPQKGLMYSKNFIFNKSSVLVLTT